MRKHNVEFAKRIGRTTGDRTNFPQALTHSVANDKGYHLACNHLLGALLRRAR